MLVSVSSYSCATNTYGSKSIENMLNGYIGLRYEIENKANDSIWHKIGESDSYIELERNVGKGCSYSIKVNKQSNIVESWKFTSDRNLCENLSYTGSI